MCEMHACMHKMLAVHHKTTSHTIIIAVGSDRHNWSGWVQMQRPIPSRARLVETASEELARVHMHTQANKKAIQRRSVLYNPHEDTFLHVDTTLFASLKLRVSVSVTPHATRGITQCKSVFTVHSVCDFLRMIHSILETGCDCREIHQHFYCSFCVSHTWSDYVVQKDTRFSRDQFKTERRHIIWSPYEHTRLDQTLTSYEWNKALYCKHVSEHQLDLLYDCTYEL